VDLIEYLKIPYAHMGRTITGVDCFGLVRLFYKFELGIDLPDYSIPYTQEWWRTENLILDLAASYNCFPTNKKDKGVIVLLRNTTSTPGHMGVIIDDSNFLHMTRNGAAVNNFLYGHYAKQVHSFYAVGHHEN